MDKPHKKLDLWALAMELVIDVYGSTKTFPERESYGLSDQIRRAAVSVPSNIAEGAARQSSKEFSKFLHIARGSLSELDTQLELAKRLGYLNENHWGNLNEAMDRIDKMISGLIRHQKLSQAKVRVIAPHASRFTPHAYRKGFNR